MNRRTAAKAAGVLATALVVQMAGAQLASAADLTSLLQSILLGSQTQPATTTPAPADNGTAGKGLTVTTTTDSSTIFEAEQAELKGVLRVQRRSRGVSGGAYVTGLDSAGESIVFHVNAPAPGRYPLVLRYEALSGDQYNDVLVNGDRARILLFPANKDFADANVCTATLRQGENTIEVARDWGLIDIDYLKVGPAAGPAAPVAGSINPVPVTPGISSNARKLYDYLVQSYGRVVLSGQHVSNGELNYIRTVSGKQPAIAGFDMVNPGDDSKALDWAKSGGIVQFQWNWPAPMGAAEFYAGKTTFDASRAVVPGTAEYQAVVADIDAVGARLKTLADAGVPVLWRPLHQAETGGFWWGAKGPDVTKQLYNMIWDRLENVRHLNNLVWVWTSSTTPNSATWYPGDSRVDIVGLEAYPPAGDYSSLSGEFDFLQALTGGRKMVAYAEAGPIPSPDTMLQLGAPWLYFATWSGEYILDGKQNSADHIRQVYLSPLVANLDKVPRFYSPAPVITTPPLVGPVSPISIGNPNTSSAGAAAFPPGYLVFQAESAILTGGAVADASNPGFTGDGYATGFDTEQATLELDININRAGDYSMLVRYLMPPAANLYVNGTFLPDKTFPDGTHFVDADLGTVRLSRGKNVIRIQSAGSSFDIDCVMLKLVQTH